MRQTVNSNPISKRGTVHKLTATNMRELRAMQKSHRAIYDQLKASGLILPSRNYFTRRFFNKMCKGEISTLFHSEITRQKLFWSSKLKATHAEDLIRQLKGSQASLKYIDHLATRQDRYYLCCVLFKTQPDQALALAQQVEDVRYKKKEEASCINTMPGDLWMCLQGKQHDDPSRRAKFGASLFRKEEYKKRGHRAQSEN